MNTTCKYLRNLTWILVVIAIGVLMIEEMNEIVRKGVILAMSISAASYIVVRDYQSGRRKYSWIFSLILIISEILICLK